MIRNANSRSIYCLHRFEIFVEMLKIIIYPLINIFASLLYISFSVSLQNVDFNGYLANICLSSCAI